MLNVFMLGVTYAGRHYAEFWWSGGENPEAVFLVVCDPSLNNL